MLEYGFKKYRGPCCGPLIITTLEIIKGTSQQHYFSKLLKGPSSQQHYFSKLLKGQHRKMFVPYIFRRPGGSLAKPAESITNLETSLTHQ